MATKTFYFHKGVDSSIVVHWTKEFSALDSPLVFPAINAVPETSGDITVYHDWLRTPYYTFIGWDTEENGTGTRYLPGDSTAIGLAPTDYYAQWVEIQPAVTISYNNNVIFGASSTTGTQILTTQNSFLTDNITIHYTGGGGDLAGLVQRTITRVSDNTITNVGAYAFYSCSQLTTVSLPNCVTINSNAFNSCSQLTTAIFPRCTTIDSYAFYSCLQLTTISFPNCVTINFNAFNFCSQLTTASFSNCTTIGSSAFANCSRLTTISFPNCTTISSYAFASCSQLTTAIFSNCIEMGQHAFYRCSRLTTAIFPVCTAIESNAFYYCYSLTTVSFPNCIDISTYAFCGCSQLTTASFPNCRVIRAYAFIECSQLTTAIFPSCSILHNCVFSKCYQLTMASFPACTKVSASAFISCYHLLSLYLLTSTVPTLANVNAFLSTPISTYTASTDGVYGSIFVKASLLASFQAATNWKTYSARMVGLTDEEIAALG